MAMARLAQGAIKMCQVLDVTVSAGERLVCGSGLVTCERKAEHVVRKILEIHAGERGLRTFVLSVAGAAQQTFRQRAVQGIGVSDLGLDVGMAGQTALFHLFTAPRRRMAG